MIETSPLPLPWIVTMSEFFTVNEIPVDGTVWPFTLPEPGNY